MASKAVVADGAEKKEGNKETAPVLEQVWNGRVWFFCKVPTGVCHGDIVPTTLKFAPSDIIGNWKLMLCLHFWQSQKYGI